MEQNKKKIELRSVEIQNAKTESGVIEGTAVVFNQIANIGELFNERIDPKAFDNCDMGDVKFLYDHDSSKVLARKNDARPNRSTLEINIDENGLNYRAKLAVDKDADSASVYSKVDRGDVDQCSFGFTVAEEDWSDLDKEIPTRTIKQIGKLYELSIVAFPAYAGTTALARDSGSLDNERLALDNARTVYEDSEKRKSELELAKAKALAKFNLIKEKK